MSKNACECRTSHEATIATHPSEGLGKRLILMQTTPTIKAVTDASIYPTKIQKIFETTKFFMPEMTRFCPVLQVFCFWLPRLHKRHFCHIVTLSHWGYISVRCLLPCRRWPPGSALISPKRYFVTLSHWGIITGSPLQLPQGGESRADASSRLKKDNNRNKKIETIEEK